MKTIALYALLVFLLAFAAVVNVTRDARSQPAVAIVDDTAQRIRGHAFGTTYCITIADEPETGFAELQRRIDLLLNGIDAQLSTYRADSELSRFNHSRETGWHAVSPAVVELVDFARQYSRLTGGAFDPTLVPVIRLWSFGGGPRRTTVPGVDEIVAALQLTGFDKIEIRRDPPALRKSIPELSLDLSALGEGYALSVIDAELQRSGAHNFFIEFGGEIVARGVTAEGNAWRAGIATPMVGERQLQCVVALSDAALSTSGSYRNVREIAGKPFSHLIDPRTGAPITHALVSVSVIDPSPLRADALATGLMVLGADAAWELAEREGIAALLIEKTEHGFHARATPQFERCRSNDAGK